jgi:hypothetical protein
VVDFDLADEEQRRGLNIVEKLGEIPSVNDRVEMSFRKTLQDAMRMGQTRRSPDPPTS